MYIQNKFALSSTLTVCLLSISFLLSAVTILHNNSRDLLTKNNPSTTNTASALLVESLPELSDMELNSQSEDSKSDESACTIATRQWFKSTQDSQVVNLKSSTNADESYVWISTDGHKLQEEILTSLNSVCVELYRDNGDTVANPSDDKFIGFTLIMDDASDNPSHYQFTNLPAGTYFAKFYPIKGQASDTIDGEIELGLVSDTNTN